MQGVGTHPDVLHVTQVAAVGERCTRLTVPDALNRWPEADYRRSEQSRLTLLRHRIVLG
ncbi:hypothetical protein ABZ468_49500 [Streptomyces sp. NPDC005708]|uniref:hypothetical protein n=1 Tax=unclassified Streptomyces TaxID=2593676 RepID=UPI0033E0C626